MRRLVVPFALLALFASPLTAFAAGKDKDKKSADDDEFSKDEAPLDEDAFKDEEEDDAPPPARLEEDDTEQSDEPIDDDDFKDVEEEELKFEDEEEQATVKPRGPGEDTAELYRAKQKQVSQLPPDEEMVQWEAYLSKYPKSLFRDRIETRMDELSVELFGERVPGSDKGATTEDAARREITFAQPIQFGSADPRSHITVGAELGIPNHFNPRVELEYAFLRELSAHAGFAYDGPAYAYTIDLGGKYALVKSVRTGFLLTALLDAKIYTAPSSFALRPGLAVGKRFDVLEGLDIQAQIGTDLELREPFAARYFGGLNATLRANEMVSVFVETSNNFKYMGSGEEDFALEGPFRFMVATFGIKFRAAKGHDPADQDGRMDLGLAANIPYSYNYWGFYRGAVGISGDYYLGPKGMNW